MYITYQTSNIRVQPVSVISTEERHNVLKLKSINFHRVHVFIGSVSCIPYKEGIKSKSVPLPGKSGIQCFKIRVKPKVTPGK